jgi:Uma2 family endonuclease
VVEILSPSNTAEEYLRKFNIYLKAGVREYWMVAPESKTAQTFVLRNGGYAGKVYDSQAILPSAVIEGLSLTLSDVFAG